MRVVEKGTNRVITNPHIPFPNALKSAQRLVQKNKLIEALKETTINIPLEEPQVHKKTMHTL